MRGRFPSQGGRYQAQSEHDDQPGIPSREARLVGVQAGTGAVLLTLDDGSTLEVAPDAVPETMPEPGEMIPPELLADLRSAAERKQVARLIFAMLDRRLQPVAKIRDKAAAEGYNPRAVEAVLEQMAARGLYSDRRYAEAYCRDCLASRAVGRRYLVDKLRQKRVPVSLASEVAAEILDTGTEMELAERAATARWKRTRISAGRQALASVVRFLQGRGFEAGTAYRVARKTQPPEDGD